MRAKVLVLEDDALLRETLEDFLDVCGFDVEGFGSSAEAMDASYGTRYVLYIVDIYLPDMSGLEFLRLLRHGGDTTPAIVVTSANDTATLQKGYASGADDYLKKPFDVEELQCRIEAVLARSGNVNTSVSINASFTLDTLHKQLLYLGEPIVLNLKDFELLALLVEHQGKVVTKEMIAKRLWSTAQEGSDGALRVYINNLKKIFGKSAIHNLRGIGYRFEP
jgi:DNA-binding response OmpR family regulator